MKFMKIKLKEIVDSRGLKASYITKNTGITKSALSNLMNNKTNSISFENLEKICKLLDITPNDIFELEQYKFSLVKVIRSLFRSQIMSIDYYSQGLQIYELLANMIDIQIVFGLFGYPKKGGTYSVYSQELIFNISL